jgi:cell division septum initiation protein DivIVA
MTVNEALDCAESAQVDDPVHVLAAEVKRLRDNSRDLRRRTQQAEKAARYTVDQIRREGFSLGRVLANAGYSMQEAEIRKLRQKVAYYIGEARYHRDCERLCSREYNRLKKGEA